MFCTSIRRRPSYAAIIPTLTSSNGLHLRESRLSTHDLSIPLSSKNGYDKPQDRQLRILLISSTSVQGEPKPRETLARIQHFASLTGGQDLAIVFLLSPTPQAPPQKPSFISAAQQLANTSNPPSSNSNNTTGIHAYTALQTLLLANQEIPKIPIFPIASLEQLPNIVQKHVTALSSRPSAQQQQQQQGIQQKTKLFELLSLCAMEAPMKRETAFHITDIFVNLGDLACSSLTVDAEMLASSSPGGPHGFDAQSQSQQRVGMGWQGGQQRAGGAEGDALAKMRCLRDLVGPEEIAGVMEFWKDEWLIE